MCLLHAQGKCITLFYFDKLHMDDEEEKWTVSMLLNTLAHHPAV
jgi:hypothetical protein